MERMIQTSWHVYQQWGVLDPRYSHQPLQGNCCTAVLCDAVGTKEAKQKGHYINIYYLAAISSQNSWGLALTAGSLPCHKPAPLIVYCQSHLYAFRSSRGGVTVPNLLIQPSLSMSLGGFFFPPSAFIGTFPVQVLPDQMLLRSNTVWKSKANSSTGFW